MSTRVGLLSYSTVRPANLALLRTSAEQLGVALVEIEPHTLEVRLDGGVQVLWRGAALGVDVVLHRTVQRHLPLVVPVLHAVAAAGTAVLNEPVAAMTSRNKLATLLRLSAAGLPVPPTQAGMSSPATQTRPPWGRRLVAKPALGVAGQHVRVVDLDRADLDRDDAHPDDAAQQSPPALGPTLLQPVIGPGTDYRAFVVGGRCVAAARRRARSGDLRANASLGARVEHVRRPELRDRVSGLAEAAVDALGLDVAAVDLLHDAPADTLHVSEVDAWGGFSHLETALGIPVSRHVLQLAVRRAGS